MYEIVYFHLFVKILLIYELVNILLSNKSSYELTNAMFGLSMALIQLLYSSMV
jgi:hypothetical protein